MSGSTAKKTTRLVVGLTGGIGSGKTAATQFFATLGAEILDADVIARIVVEPGTNALHCIAAHFGTDILQADGSLNRSQLRQLVFSDPAQRRWLETLLHPLIRAEIENRLHTASSPYVILASPLLLETGLDSLTDRVLLIDVPAQLQIERTRQRDKISSDAVAAIIATQWTREQRLLRADDVIINDGDLLQLEHAVKAKHQQYLVLSTR